MIHPESDYAYAFFVEEYGFILAVLLLMLYLWVFFGGIEIFRRCGTAFPGLLVLGLALLITCQALLHIMVTVNLDPDGADPAADSLRGGSSMLFTMIAFWMISERPAARMTNSVTDRAEKRNATKNRKTDETTALPAFCRGGPQRLALPPFPPANPDLSKIGRTRRRRG